MSGPLDRLTVLVPTRNRYPRLLRLLRYLASAKPALRVVVLDGSSDETDLGVLDAAVVSAGAQYRRFGPEVSLMAKIVSGLESVETEYVVWLADDDFTVPRTLEACAKHLDENPSCAIVHGRSALAITRPSGNGLEVASIGEYPQRPVAAGTAAKRLVDHLEHCCSTFYSMHRTEDMRRSTRLCLEAGFDLNWGEYFLTSMSVLPGGVDMIEGLYMVREAHEAQVSVSLGRDYFDIMTAENAGATYAKLRAIVVEEIARIDGVDAAAAEAVVKQAWWAFLSSTLATKYQSKYLAGSSASVSARNAVKRIPGARALVKAFRRTAPGAGFPGSLTNPANPYHADYEAIRKALESPL